MREWIRLKLLEKLGGYPDVLAAIEAVSTDEERREVLNLAVRRLYNTIGAEDILRVNEDNDWVFMGKVLPSGVKDLLIAEAEQLQDMKLWEVLNADIKYQANKAMFLNSRTDLDITAGKLWIHTLKLINRRIKRIAAGSGIAEAPKKKG